MTSFVLRFELRPTRLDSCALLRCQRRPTADRPRPTADRPPTDRSVFCVCELRSIVSAVRFCITRACSSATL